ncbi:MAG TPA: hypothetical protein VG710_02975 [Opitutus sp.]|nr:hypothetical protein [Opitutus sp.]
MKKPRLFPLAFLALVVLASLRPANAMSVRAPTFPELVAEASMIAHTRVTAVTSRAVTSPDDQRVIKTFVTFTTITPLKGQPGSQFTLSFLGGADKHSGERWTVPGMPQFQVGDEDIIFATRGESVCPLVAARHGRYRVLTDAATNRRYIARSNREPLAGTDEISGSLEPVAPAAPHAARIAAALSPENFEQRITAEIAHPTQAAHP